jgi:hypothetical protein
MRVEILLHTFVYNLCTRDARQTDAEPSSKKLQPFKVASLAV